MANATRLMHLAGAAPSTVGQATEEVYIDNLPQGGGTPPAGSVTPAALSGYDAGTGKGKVPQVKSDGSGFDLIDPATLRGANGPAGPAGKSVKALTLTTDASGKVTGGTVTFSDSSTAPVTVITTPAA